MDVMIDARCAAQIREDRDMCDAPCVVICIMIYMLPDLELWGPVNSLFVN